MPYFPPFSLQWGSTSMLMYRNARGRLFVEEFLLLLFHGLQLDMKKKIRNVSGKNIRSDLEENEKNHDILEQLGLVGTLTQ